MKLYPVPGGGWEPTEADWKKAMKAKGLDPKQFEATKTREVPTGKKELIEFLTFFGVDVYRLPDGGTTVSEPVDLDALRKLHNPDGVRPSDLGPQYREAAPAGEAIVPLNDFPLDLATMFEAAPIRVQAELVVGFADRAVTLAGNAP